MEGGRQQPTSGEGGIVIIEEFLAIEGHETLQDAVADTSGADGADDLALEIKRVARDVRDLPVTTLDHLQMPHFRSARSLIRDVATHFMSRNKVPNKEEYGHHDVFGN